MKNSLDEKAIDLLVVNALSEDIQGGDITTRNIFSENKNANAEVIARETMILCGLDVFQAVFKKLDANVRFSSGKFSDGDEVAAGETVVKVECDVIPLLEGERSALNILQWLSGIATLTQKYVKKAAPVKILDTRKTTPGLRMFEKYAVACGGGINHRFGLYDQVLIKDNHIEAAGGISNAVRAVRKNLPEDKKIEVEVQSVEEVNEALENHVDIIMLDNMALGMMRQCIALINGKAKTEISGGVTFERLEEISTTGADFVSVGALTHSAPAVDISMCITPE
ncbi:MAG: nicotinate-nucleotide pyrophosphorylase (carboxylating) [Nitrospinales bacterium]|jgi:nicotinate-nucleotide pyrophosphorylase (carboxylating)